MNIMRLCVSILGLLLLAVAFSGCTGSEPAKETTAGPADATPEITPEMTVTEPSAEPVSQAETKEAASGEDLKNLSFADQINVIQQRIDSQPPTELKIGETAVVALQENPTTGYSWNATVTSGLAIVNDTFIAPDSQLVGAGGEHRWTVEGTAAGNQTFSAVYRRPWENVTPEDVTYLQQFVVTG